MRLPLLALAVVLPMCLAGPLQDMFYGKVQIVQVHGRDLRTLNRNRSAVGHEHHVNLQLKSGELRRLLFPVEVEQLPRTGAHVVVKAQELTKCTSKPQRDGALCVASMMAHEAAPKDIYEKGQQRGNITVKALLMQLDICNWGIPVQEWDRLEGAFWSGLEKSQLDTVESMFSGCSFGMAKVTKAAGGHILRVPVPIPCKGKTPDGFYYESKDCPFNEWSDVANDWVRRNTDINLDDYPHKVYLVTKGDTCGWGGMGYVGCNEDCRAWINGDLWDEPTTYFHEISHNFYLNHAGKWGNDGYDDMSGAMGYCCDLRCHNAPHSHQLGWAGPVKTLHKDNWPAGQWNTYKLPAAALEPKNFVRIWPDWNGKSAKRKLYVQYRKRVGYDLELSNDDNGVFRDRVMIYSVDAADPQPYTSWEAGVDAGQEVREVRLNTSVVLRVIRYVGDSAEIKLCRWSEKAESSCGDGLDNDCDGYVDSEDTDCKGKSS